MNNAATAYKNADPTPFAEQTERLRVDFHGTLDTERLLLFHPDAIDPRIVSVASMAGRLGQVSPELQRKFSSPSLGLAELCWLVGQFESAVASGTHARQGWGKSNYGMSKLAVIAATRAGASTRRSRSTAAAGLLRHRHDVAQGPAAVGRRAKRGRPRHDAARRRPDGRLLPKRTAEPVVGGFTYRCAYARATYRYAPRICQILITP